jgi:nucleotide-binding universal stress UspA family protein
VQRILVGVDGSDNGRRALEWGLVLAGRFHSEIVAVHAIGLLTHLDPGPPVPSQAHLEELRHTFQTEWCASLAASGLAHRMLCRDGPPVSVLLEVAESEAVDLIVLGRRGTGGSAELLLGSTSHQVAEQSGRPVLIVPPSGSDHDTR